MLPDFPQIKSSIQKEINNYLRGSTKASPIMSKIRVVRQFEGDSMAIQTEDGETDASPYEEIREEFKIDLGAIIENGPTALVENIQNAAETMSQKQSELVFKRISEVVDKSGRTVNGGGKPFSFEVYLEGLQTVDIDFDKDGKPRLPVLCGPPTFAAKVKAMLKDLENNQDYKNRFDAVIEEKRKEWNARESNRILVD
jgi:hypothetical protein